MVTLSVKFFGSLQWQCFVSARGKAVRFNISMVTVSSLSVNPVVDYLPVTPHNLCP